MELLPGGLNEIMYKVHIIVSGTLQTLSRHHPSSSLSLYAKSNSWYNP